MEWWAILVSILGAVAGLTELIKFFVNRYDKAKELQCANTFTSKEREEILNSVRLIPAIELDTARLQLLNLIQHSPKNVDTILYQAKHYFKDLNGNTYMVSVFCDWAKSQNIDEEIVKEMIRNNGNK